MAAFGGPSPRQSVKASSIVNGNQFYMERTQTLDEGWFSIYKPYIQLENMSLPPMKKGQQVSVEKVVVEDKFTKPPARYNPSSLLRKMEKEDIGTKATRAGIIQTLYDRKYVHDEKMSVTDLGLEAIEVLKNHCPAVASSELTRKLEQKMDEIQQGKETRENGLREAS